MGSEARVADPVLTEHARGYMPEMLAHEALFPVVDVTARAGKIVVFGTQHMRRLDLQRAQSSNRQMMRLQYGNNNYRLVQRAIDGTVDFEDLEEAAAIPGVDMGRAATSMALDVVLLQTEIEAAALATNTGSYSATNHEALAGNSQWSHANSKPAAAVAQKCQIIADKVGIWPNTLVVGASVHKSLINNPDVVDRVKHTTNPTGQREMAMQHMAAYFDVDRYVVAKSRYQGVEGGDFTDIWGKVAILAVTGRSTMRDGEANRALPSFGYTYRLRGYPLVAPYWEDRERDVYRYPVTNEAAPVIAGKDAAFLFRTVVP